KPGDGGLRAPTLADLWPEAPSGDGWGLDRRSSLRSTAGKGRKSMYELYAERSPNVYKVAIALEELGAPWREVWVDVARGDQHAPAFLAISPNGRVPALIDPAPGDGGPPLAVWESGNILVYLAEKTGKFLPASGRGR